jgi:hypothetical protein
VWGPRDYRHPHCPLAPESKVWLLSLSRSLPALATGWKAVCGLCLCCREGSRGQAEPGLSAFPVNEDWGGKMGTPSHFSGTWPIGAFLRITCSRSKTHFKIMSLMGQKCWIYEIMGALWIRGHYNPTIMKPKPCGGD